MAKVLQRLSKSGHYRTLLASSSVCPSYVNLQSQRKTLLWKNRIYFDRRLILWLQHNYKYTLQELRCYLIGRKRELQAKEMLAYFSENSAESDIVSFIMSYGGSVKFIDDDIWYKVQEKGDLPFSKMELIYLIAEGIDLTGIEEPKFWIDKICLDYLVLFRMHDTKLFDDWCIDSLIRNCPSITALDIRGCTSVTSNGLELLHKLRHLQVLDITGCTGINCPEAVCSYLLDFCPDLVVLGLDSLKETDKTSCLSKYERENSRYLNWSLVIDQINGLDNMSRLEKRQSADLITGSTQNEQSYGQG